MIFYIHPREIDPYHPRLPMGLKRKFKSYVNLKTTEAKIRRVLAHFEVTTFRAFIEDHIEQFIPASEAPAAVAGPVADSEAGKLGSEAV